MKAVRKKNMVKLRRVSIAIAGNEPKLCADVELGLCLPGPAVDFD
jgi:hypothetical protein